MKNLTCKFVSVILAITTVISMFCIDVSAVTATLATPVIKVAVSNSTTNPTLKLSWAKIEGATKYYIYKRETASGNLSLVAKTTSLYYKDAGLDFDQTYYYRVMAVKIQNGKTTAKSEASKMISAMVVKKASVSAKSTSESAIKLTFSGNTGARYYMYYATSKSGKYTALGYTTKTSYTVKELNANTTYYFKIITGKVANSKVYKSGYSKVVSAKTSSKAGEVTLSMPSVLKTPSSMPNGDGVTCLTMALNYAGINVKIDEMYNYFVIADKSEFYTKDGRDYGPDCFGKYVVDPKDKKVLAYGCDISAIGIAYLNYLNYIGKENDSYYMEGWDFTGVKKTIDYGLPVIALLRTSDNNNIIMWIYEKTQSAAIFYTNMQYYVIYGYTDSQYICINPKSGKTEYVTAEPAGWEYDVIDELTTVRFK